MTPTALGEGLWNCLACEQLNRAPARADIASCARCGAAIHARKPNSFRAMTRRCTSLVPS